MGWGGMGCSRLFGWLLELAVWVWGRFVVLGGIGVLWVGLVGWVLGGLLEFSGERQWWKLGVMMECRICGGGGGEKLFGRKGVWSVGGV